jgi:hypothetical protein
MLVTKFRGVWTMEPDAKTSIPEQQAGQGEEDAESDEESDDDEDDDEEPQETETEAVEEPKEVSAKPARYRMGTEAYNQFLVYLQRGCNGCPSEGYPTVLVILSTLPAEVSCR